MCIPRVCYVYSPCLLRALSRPGRKPLTSSQRREGVQEAQKVYEEALQMQQDDSDSGADSISYTRKDASELFAQHEEALQMQQHDSDAGAVSTAQHTSVFDPWSSATPALAALACPPMLPSFPLAPLPMSLTPAMIRQQHQMMQQYSLPFTVTPEMLRAQQKLLQQYNLC